MKEKPSSPEQNIQNKYEADEEGYVSFGDVARGEIGIQAQYASRYLREFQQQEEKIRTKGSATDYHSLRIHKDDIEKFVDFAKSRLP